MTYTELPYEQKQWIKYIYRQIEKKEKLENKLRTQNAIIEAFVQEYRNRFGVALRHPDKEATS